MTFGIPHATAPLLTLAFGSLLLFLPQARLLFTRGSRSAFVLVAASFAALLSGAYVAFYLRGGPRIVDATTYYLEARALAEGHLAWPIPDPSASVTGRFLVRDTLGSGDHLAAIFPPGYPLLLAVGFWLGSPMIVGPALAFAVTYVTAFVADASIPDELRSDRETAVRLAVVLSVLCAALRYHTADTMSHGLAACLAGGAVGCALRLRRGYGIVAVPPPVGVGFALGLGACLGWLACTRPVSAMALVPVTLFVAMPGLAARSIAAGSAAASPFVALFFLHQRAATGRAWSSSQALYYATSDTPAGCFTYGFGDGIGCRYEHGDFVERYMSGGHGALEAIGTTARRLALHSMDALNAAPLGLLLVAAFVLAWRRPSDGSTPSARPFGPRVLTLAFASIVVAYAPFYFDGNVPGAGARFFADVLPLEHVLIAWGIARVAAPRALAARAAAWSSGVALVGFSFFAHADHEHLRDREGGRPMFEPSVLRDAGVTGGLVFVDTDHGFSLGHDPFARAAHGTVEVARYRGDAIDAFLWEARGRPPAWIYRYGVADGRVRIDPYVPTEQPGVEAESMWPAVEQNFAAALPGHAPEPCASAGRWLVIASDPSAAPGPARVRMALPSALSGRRIVPIVAAREGVRGSLAILAGGRAISSLPLSFGPLDKGEAPCREAPLIHIPEGHTELELRVTLEVETSGVPVSIALDALRLEASAAGGPGARRKIR